MFAQVLDTVTWEIILPFLFFFAGFVGRVILPYAESTAVTGKPFDWRFVVGQLVGALIGVLIPFLLSDGAIADIGVMGWIGAFGYGWGLTDIGRLGQKAYKRLREGVDRIQS